MSEPVSADLVVVVSEAAADVEEDDDLLGSGDVVVSFEGVAAGPVNPAASGSDPSATEEDCLGSNVVVTAFSATTVSGLIRVNMLQL